MNSDNKIIAQYLYDLAKESKCEFVEISKDSDLVKVAEKMNLVVPSPDISILKIIYAQTNVPNLNKILLPHDAVKKALPSLVGKQANWSHIGQSKICGWILDGKLEKDLIIIYVAIFKSIWQEEFETVKSMFTNNKLSCSFEIWNKAEDGSSVLHDLGNGIKSIDPILFHGVGILIGDDEKPACPKAYGLKLLALFKDKTIRNAEKIVDKVFNRDLIFASQAIEEPTCKNCGKCNCEKEVKVITKKIDSKEWICPYCEKAIGEKELFFDEKTSKWYHRPCQEKGEIILPKENAKKGGDKNIMLEELYSKVTKEEEITFDIAMAFYYASDEEKAKLTEDAAKWTRKFINGLPDSAFAVIEPAYPEKVEDKNCRHLPHHNGEGDLGKDKSNTNLDLPHYKNALARCNQIKPVSDSISAEELQKKAGTHLERHKDALEKSSEETKAEVKPEETKPIEGAETKPVETKAEETKGVVAEVKPEETKEVAQPLEVVEPKIIVKVTMIYSEVSVDTYIDGTPSGTHEMKGYNKKITEYKDGTKDEIESEITIEKKYSFAELEEKLNATKAEKDTEIATLKAEHERILGEKDIEIKNKNEELGKKDQEIAQLKTPKVEKATVEESPILDVGAVGTKEDKYKKMHDNVHALAWGTKKDKEIKDK